MLIHQVYAHYPRQEHVPMPSMYTYCPICRSALGQAQSGHMLRPTCPECGFVQYRNPAPTVSALVVDGSQVLLGRRGGHPGKGAWALPSGYVEYEDDFLTTAILEVKEETGLDVELCALINVVSSFLSPGFHFLSIFVTAHVVGGDLAAGDDLDEAAWYPLSGPLPEMSFREDVEVIRLYASGCPGLPIDPAYAAQDPGSCTSPSRPIQRP